VPDNALAAALLEGWQSSGGTHAKLFVKQQRPLLGSMHSTLLLLLLLLLLHVSWPGAHCVPNGGGLGAHVAPVAGQY
jgi:hypothetical protein